MTPWFTAAPFPQMIKKGFHALDANELVLRLHRHRMWVNRRLIEAARTLDTNRLHQPFAIGQGTIWSTLTHLLGAEYVWLETLLGDESPLLPGDAPGKLPGNQEGQPKIQSLDELASKWQELDRRWVEYLGNLKSEQLDDLVYKIKSSSPPTRSATRTADILLHVCTHAHYTTAQLMNMLRQLDVSPLPDVMLITMARQEMES